LQFSSVEGSEILAEGHVADDVDGQVRDPCCEINKAVVLLRMFAETACEFSDVVL
jgi:hypothetical protein